MSLLVVGSVALDTVETPHGKAEMILGGSANYFAAAATLLGPVQIVGVVGHDYPLEELDFLRERGADLSGIEQVEGESFFWAGRYSPDFSMRETLETRLGVFADFQPRIPEAFRDARLVFLGNIDPVLQLQVLDQVDAPELVACDTMNYWIDGSRDALMELLGRVDILVINDEEARHLAETANLVKAAGWIRSHGPPWVVVKKGEHGAVLFGPGDTFFAPGYPLSEVFDPTGAGDAFAGGFMGYLTGSSDLGAQDLRRAMIYGSATGSFAVEKFGIDRFLDLTAAEIAGRVEEFRRMTAFEHEPSLVHDGREGSYGE